MSLPARYLLKVKKTLYDTTKIFSFGDAGNIRRYFILGIYNVKMYGQIYVLNLINSFCYIYRD